MTDMRVTPVTLEGRYVRLEPLTLGHEEALSRVGLDEDLWRWIPVPVRTRQEMAAYVETALRDQASGMALPVVLVQKSSARGVGSTRYANIQRAHQRREIGWQWT